MCASVCERGSVRVCYDVRESGSALRLYRIDSTGVVSVEEMSHKVKLKLHSSEGGEKRKRGEKV